MKKYILSIIFSIGLLFSFAQSATANMTGNGDTLTNADTEYVTLSPSVYYEQATFQAVVTKLSGTVAGTALLQYSNDNVNFIDANTDTLTFANQTTNTKAWPIAFNNQYYYRIKFISSGTVSARVFGYFIGGGPRGKHAVSTMKSNYGLTSDTCTNSATTYVGLTVSNWYNRLSIHCVVTKISGTVAGTVTVQGSVDGTNYVTVDSNFITAQTLAPSNQTTNQKVFVVTGSPYKYYRLSYTGSGTMSAILKGYVVPNR